MDRKNSKQSTKSKGGAGKAWGIVISLTVVLSACIYGYRHSIFKNLTQTYTEAWNSANDKALEIQTALEENERLKYENSNLRLKLETTRFEALKMQAKEESLVAVQAAKSGKKTSSSKDARSSDKVSRSLASIGYEPPGNLLPSQLYTLGVTYFKAQENEKAAVIFSFLTQLEDNDAYRSARNYLITGVSWYRLANVELADHFFDLALKEPDKSENLRYQAQARLWKGILAKKAGKSDEAQYWLKDLLDHHPQSTEASWVNSQEASRAPAREE